MQAIIEKEKKSVEAESQSQDEETLIAVAMAVILHRCGPENIIPLLGCGESDEGAWGRSSRAGMHGAFLQRR